MGLFCRTTFPTAWKARSAVAVRRKTSAPAPRATVWQRGNAIAPSLEWRDRSACKPTTTLQRQGPAPEDLTEHFSWNLDAPFFEARLESGEFFRVSEHIGFTSWYFDLPTAAAATKQRGKINGRAGLLRPVRSNYGGAASRISNRIRKLRCQWNRPRRQFATAITLCALADELMPAWGGEDTPTSGTFSIVEGSRAAIETTSATIPPFSRRPAEAKHERCRRLQAHATGTRPRAGTSRSIRSRISAGVTGLER